MRRFIVPTCVVAIAITAFAPSFARDGDYRLVREIKVGGEGGWDYLLADADARRLYVSHATQVEVLNIDNGSVVGTIGNTQGVHGIALAPDLGRGFTSNGRAATVTLFERSWMRRMVAW